MFRLRALTLPLACLVLCGLPAAAGAVVFGSSVDGDFDRYVSGSLSLDQVRASLRELRTAGASVAQTGSGWAQTEPKPPVHGRYRYDWTYADTIVSGLAGAHLRWEPTLDYTPKWAQQQHIKPVKDKWVTSPLPPANDNVYAAYAAALASRYGVGGSFWRTHPRLPPEPVTNFTIWNEPDCRWTWGPNVNLQDYARLYSAAYRAIKRVDPHSTVVTAGLAFNRSSLPRLLRAVKGLPVDAFALHPYGPNANATIAVVRWSKTQLAGYGRPSTPLIVNEYGWNSAFKPWQWVPKRVLRSYVLESIVGLSAINGVAEVIPFEWTNPAWGLNGGGLAAGIKQARKSR